MGSLDDIDGTSSRDDRDTETEEETTTLELANVAANRSRTVDDRTNDDDPSANLHANFPSPGVDGRANEEEGAHPTDLVHGGVNGRPFAILRTVEESEEGLVRRETTEDGPVETVHRLSEASEQEASEEAKGGRVEQPRAFLDESLIEGLRAANDLDLGDVGLSPPLVSNDSTNRYVDSLPSRRSSRRC